jgi:hypothetical protein
MISFLRTVEVSLVLGHEIVHTVSNFVKEKNVYLEHDKISVAKLLAMNTYRVMLLWIHILLTLALEKKDKWSASCPGRLTPGK